MISSLILLMVLVVSIVVNVIPQENGVMVLSLGVSGVYGELVE